ncbi:unnamed protein product [simian adenovirus 27]
MAKRVRLSSSFNPVYPYEDESSSQHPFINPGFISSNGFTQSPDGVLTLKCVAPLTTTSGALDIKVGGGLKVDSTDGSLEEDMGIAAPLTKVNHSVGLALGDGLETKENKLYVKLGEGLKFNSGSINIDHDINTLWTGVNPSANCIITEDGEANDSKLTLILVKTGGLVNAYVSLMGDSEAVNKLTTDKSAQITVDIYFDNEGKVLTELSALKTGLKHKFGQNMASDEAQNCKGFMPSLTAYPFRNPTKPTKGREDYIYGITYYQATDGTLYELKTTVTLNYSVISSLCAYAMHISWSWDSVTEPETTPTTLITSPFSFSYIREDD